MLLARLVADADVEHHLLVALHLGVPTKRVMLPARWICFVGADNYLPVALHLGVPA